VPGGREPYFAQDVANAVCDKLMLGKSLRSICAEEGMPSQPTVFKWIRENEQFAEQYARARDTQADTLADQITDIADDASDDPNSRRVRIDARKWIAAKLKPKKYGDRAGEAGQDPDNPIRHVLEVSFGAGS
jgi:hypothetical protein